MYKHILIPTDGSDLSRKAVQHGVLLAKAMNAKVTSITVISPSQILALEPDIATATLLWPNSRSVLHQIPTREPDTVATTRGHYEKHMGRFASRCLDEVKTKAAAEGVSCEVLTVWHDQPYQAIIDAANNQHCDLIVMASHGRRGISALVLGSETVKVLTHSTIPVLVCR